MQALLQTALCSLGAALSTVQIGSKHVRVKDLQACSGHFRFAGTQGGRCSSPPGS